MAQDAVPHPVGSPGLPRRRTVLKELMRPGPSEKLSRLPGELTVDSVFFEGEYNMIS